MRKTFLISVLALLGMSQVAAQEYEYVPFVREGVKWVYFYDNSDAIINPDYEPGKHYFKLELKGDTVINGKTYKAMHKYSGSSINWENDTIPVYLREEDKIVYGIIPDGKKYYDCPVGHTFDTFYNGQEFVLYDFVDPVRWWDNYINIGWNDIFYFQSMDTISLGNQYAKRYYWKESETWDYYQVEGVGADAEFNGYTLFPLKDIYVYSMNVFFYLSHVIENGRIIYKGIHYDPDNLTAVDEVAADKSRQTDSNYYNLMGQPMGKEMPTTPGIYIHHGKKIVVK